MISLDVLEKYQKTRPDEYDKNMPNFLHLKHSCELQDRKNYYSAEKLYRNIVLSKISDMTIEHPVSDGYQLLPTLKISKNWTVD